MDYTRVVPEIRRQNLKCFKMASDIDITLHVCTFTCIFHFMIVHKQLNKHYYVNGSHNNATPTCTEHFENFSHYIDKNSRP